jgi:hypothetical protein
LTRVSEAPINRLPTPTTPALTAEKRDAKRVLTKENEVE